MSPLEEVYTVVFDKNGGHTEASPQSKTVEPPTTTIDELPEAPTREGYKFLGWNTQADGSGAVFTANTLVRENLTVYAQWENLNISILPSSATLTPIVDGAYTEHSTRFRVVVSGFDNAADAGKATLGINYINGLSFEVESNPEGNTQSFEVSVEYNGQAAFPEGFATIKLSLENISGYSAESKNTRIYIRDGQAAGPSRAIPVNQANILAFNRYANTADGLKKHYRLTENISLAEPAQPTESNWTAIGTELSPFVGSFNGENHELLRLRMRASGSDYQGLFGHIGEGATLENIRLIDVSVSGRSYVGGLVGLNYQGTVQNSYATGSVTASNNYAGGLVGNNFGGTVHNSYASGSVSGSSSVGGLVGHNFGTVQNSYASGSVNGSNNNVGGLVGSNSGTVQNSYASGSVNGNNQVGGLVGGGSYDTVHNSYATGSVNGNNQVGGLVGSNFGGTVHNSYATGSVTGSGTSTYSGWSVGGLVGYNHHGTVQNCYATGSVTGDGYVGGLVGQNYSTVQNSLALNPRVSGTADVGRVAGRNENNGALIDNYAFSGMENSAGSSTSWSNIGLRNLDGVEISAGQLRRRDGFPPEFLSTPWTYVENHLPGLLGQPLEMPAHIP